MKVLNTLPLAPILAAGILLLGACGEAEEQATSNTAVVKTQPASSKTKPESKPEKVDMCSFMSASAVSAALEGKLPLGPPKSQRDGCSYPVQFGLDGNFLSYNKLSRGIYDANKNWEKQKGVKFEYLEGLGQQAFILNNAQLCVLVNETDAYMVRAQVMAMGEELPLTQEELKAGLIKIATELEPHF